MADEGRSRNGKAAAAEGEGGLPGEAAVTNLAKDARATATHVDDASGRDTEDAGDETAAGDGETNDAGTDDGGADGVGTDDGGQSPAPQTGPHAGSLDAELVEARRAAQEHLDRALRAQAELENVRRRMARDVENAHKFALERFVSDLLPVKDSLELGLAASAEKGASAAGIAEGIELTLRMFMQAMEKFGVKAVDPAGEPFDPQFHQAITMQESATAESGTVLTVVQKGYLLNERLVRPAMVIVAK